MIEIKKYPGQKVLELGGGDNPNPATDINVDVRSGPKVNFTHNFDEFPWPIGTDEFDCVLSFYVLEHLSWRTISQAIREIFRILKPGGKFVATIPNTEAQIQWLKNNPNGWDDKNSFESFSCILYGDQDYNANAHRCYFSPQLITELLQKEGFNNIVVQPYGERATDLFINVEKPNVSLKNETKTNTLNANTTEERAGLFDKEYFNGGKKVGGYAREGYWDYPVHEVTAQHILDRKPESVLELGAARGYVLKRIQDKGIHGKGLEISKHCWLSRVTDEIHLHDICNGNWPIKDKELDLCYSIATMEHIPEEHLPTVISEMVRVSKRGLHGIDFGHNDDGFDKTHTTLKPKSFWVDIFNKYAPNYPVEIVDKEELEKGTIPESVLKGDGKVKLNIGSFTTMYHHGWVNIDIHDLSQFANHFKYNFKQLDVRQGLPYGTQTVDLISCCHMLEHLSYQEALQFLRECRRVMKSDSLMRIQVPNADYLIEEYWDGDLSKFNEINDGSANAPTKISKLWELLFSGHQAMYDWESLDRILAEAGFDPILSDFRTSFSKQMLAETLDMMPCLSLYYEAKPKFN